MAEEINLVKVDFNLHFEDRNIPGIPININNDIIISAHLLAVILDGEILCLATIYRDILDNMRFKDDGIYNLDIINPEQNPYLQLTKV